MPPQQPAWMADAVPVTDLPPWMADAVPVPTRTTPLSEGGEPQPAQSGGMGGRAIDAVLNTAVDPISIAGQYVLGRLLDSANEGTFQRDAAVDSGFLDRSGSLLERGTANSAQGIYSFLGGLGSGDARERAAALARGTTTQDVAGATGWEDVNDAGSLASFALDAGIESAPAMALMALPYVGIPATVASQTGNIAEQRAQNNGTELTAQDLLEAAPFAAASTALDRFGLKGITNPVGNTIAGRVVGAAMREGLTEGVQSGIEYGGGTLGTERGADWNTALDQMLAGSVAGAGMGGATRGGAEIAAPLTSRIQARQGNTPAPANDATDWEGSLDEQMGRNQPVLALPKPDWMADAVPVDAVTPTPDTPVRPAANARASGDVDSIIDAYMARTRGAESGGNDHAANPRSSADGRYQFIDSTWAQYHNRIYGGDGLNDKFDPTKQERIMREFTRDNANALARAGIPITEASLYQAHHFGRAGAIAMHRNPSAPVDPAVVSANPQFENMTNAQALAWTERHHGGSGGSVAPSGDAAAIGTDSVDIPGADGSLLGRGSDQAPIAQIDIPEAEPASPVDAENVPGAVVLPPLPGSTSPDADTDAPSLPGFDPAPAAQVPSGNLFATLQALTNSPNLTAMAPEQVRPLTARTDLMARVWGLNGQAEDIENDPTPPFDRQVARLALGDREAEIADAIDRAPSGADRADILARIPDEAIEAIDRADELVTATYSLAMTERQAAAGNAAAKKALPGMKRQLNAARKAAKDAGVAVPGVERLVEARLAGVSPASAAPLAPAPDQAYNPAPDAQADRPAGQPAAAGPDGNQSDGGSRRAVPTLARGQLRALGIAQELRTEKAAALVGRTAATPRELAEIAQVYRDPRYETFRIFYTKGDMIVHATGVSSRSISEAPIMPADMDSPAFYQSMKDTMQASGADGYYLLHNHPSGDPDASQADKTVTRNIAQRVPGFRSHVVINSDKYARIQIDAAGRTRSNMAALETDNRKLQAALPHDLLGTQIARSSRLAEVAKGMQKPGYVTVIGLDAKLAVRVILEYPAATARRDTKALMAMARRIQRQSGAGRLMLVGDKRDVDTPTVARAIKAGVIFGAVDTNGNTIGYALPRAKGLPQSPGRYVAEPAYHGSPHTFDRFSLDAIGTGEGNQTYGWGLYFAGKKEIAEYYREALSRERGRIRELSVDGKPINPNNKTQNIAADLALLVQTYGEKPIVDDYGSLEAWVRSDVQARGFGSTADDIFAAFSEMRGKEVGEKYIAGRLYQVEIPDDGEYLLWDKPFPEQPEMVRKGIEQALARINTDPKEMAEIIFDSGDISKLTGRRIYEKMIDLIPYERSKLEATLGDDAWGRTDKIASLLLRDAGIAGTKYLDGGSRTQGEGSFNYVLFDDSRVEIRGVSEQSTPFHLGDDPKDPTGGLVDKDGLTRDAARIKAVVGNPLTALKGMLRSGAAETGRTVFYSTDARLRGMAKRYNSQAISDLADLFHAQAGAMDKPVTETYHEAVDREGFGRVSQAFGALEKFIGNKAAMERIGLMLRDPSRRMKANKSEAEAAAKIAALLKDTIDYRKAAGEDIGEVTDGYFPRFMDVEKVVANRDLFLRQATELYRKHGSENPEKSAEAWMARIFDQYAGLDGGLEYASLFHDTRPAGVGRKTTKSREFGKDADKLLGTFYDNDTGSVLTGYFLGAARKAEEARRFGTDGTERHKMRAMMERIRKDIRASGEDAGDALDTIAQIVNVNLGRIEQPSQGWRAFSSFLHTASQLGTLDRAAYTSLSEAMMGFVRGGPKYGLSMLKDSAVEAAKQVKAGDKSEAAKIAEVLGIATDALIAEAMTSRSGFERNQTSRRAQQVQFKFFKATGLMQWTEGTRIAATRMGQKLLRDLAADMQGRNPKRAAGYLQELGVTDPQAFAKWLTEGGDPVADDVVGQGASEMARQYRTAMMRFVNQTIMKPSRAQKPSWASHPVYGLLFSLMSYSYGFKKNVLDRVGTTGLQGIKEGDPTLLYPAFGLAGMFVVHTVLNNVLRQALFGGGREEDEDEGISILDALEALDRAGIFGPASRPLNAVLGLKYRNGIIPSMLGPTVGRPAELAEKTLGLATDANSPNTNTAERAAAGAVYDIVLEPALEAYGVTRFATPIASPLVWATGNREGGILPSDREMFIEAVAGAKEAE